MVAVATAEYNVEETAATTRQDTSRAHRKVAYIASSFTKYLYLYGRARLRQRPSVVSKYAAQCNKVNTHECLSVAIIIIIIKVIISYNKTSKRVRKTNESDE